MKKQMIQDVYNSLMTLLVCSLYVIMIVGFYNWLGGWAVIIVIFTVPVIPFVIIGLRWEND